MQYFAGRAIKSLHNAYTSRNIDLVKRIVNLLDAGSAVCSTDFPTKAFRNSGIVMMSMPEPRNNCESR